MQRIKSPLHDSVQILGCYMTSVCSILLEKFQMILSSGMFLDIIFNACLKQAPH